MVYQSSINWVIQQANVRVQLRAPYVYGGTYAPTRLWQGGDCSGVGGWALQALTQDPNGLPLDANGNYLHIVSTESWYYDYGDNVPAAPGTIGPFGTIAVASLADIPADAALTVNIMHRGGGVNSHMNVVVPVPGSLPYEGVIVESNGNAGSCTNNNGGNPSTASLWTDHSYLPGPWVFDVPPVDPSQPYRPTPDSAMPTWTVQIGDTLASIAIQNDVSLGALEAANPQIVNPNLIYVGEVINLP